MFVVAFVLAFFVLIWLIHFTYKNRDENQIFQWYEWSFAGEQCSLPGIPQAPDPEKISVFCNGSLLLCTLLVIGTLCLVYLPIETIELPPCDRSGFKAYAPGDCVLNNGKQMDDCDGVSSCAT